MNDIKKTIYICGSSGMVGSSLIQHFKSKNSYTDIYTIIKKATSLNLYSSLNNIKDIIDYHEKFENELQALYRNII